jgi:CDGSH-type Zn-finger protein
MMATSDNSNTNTRKRIVVQENGPYQVYGDIPLLRKTQVVSEYGEPLTWKTEGKIATGSDGYDLCRCGHSRDMPFCDGTHRAIEWDSTETADSAPTATRQFTYPGSKGIVVRCDQSLCTDSGFCGTRFEGIAELAAKTKNTQVRALVMAMIEHCPSGSLTYAIKEGEPDVEPDLPQAIAVTTEITDDGPIEGPLWVTGGIPIERADGQPFETRNRVTLCSCGRSSQKPLCDGVHRAQDETHSH